MMIPRLVCILLLPLGSLAALRRGEQDRPKTRKLAKPKPPMTSGGLTEDIMTESMILYEDGGTCRDHIKDWHDSDGKYYDCEWYAQNDYCVVYGNDYKNMGKTAKQNCCACDGGVECSDTVGWTDSEGLGCGWYSVQDRCCLYGDDYRNNGKTANEACCVCGGGVVEGACEDLKGGKIPSGGWYDVDGPQYDCEWYSHGNRCKNYGHSYRNFGYVANQACCVCGGGV